MQNESTGEDLVNDNMNLTPTQISQLLQLLGREKQNDNASASTIESKVAYVAGKLCLISTSHSWIMDSGATDHMCYDLTMFSII